MASVFARFPNHLGLQWKDWRQGLVMATGSIIIFAVVYPDAVWDTLKTRILNTTLPIVFWAVLCPACSGFTVFAVPLISVGLLFAIACYAIILECISAATGGSFHPGPAKAWTLGVVATVVVTLLHFFRVRFPAFDFIGFMSQLLSPLFFFALYMAPMSPSTPEAMWRFVVLMMLPVFVGIVVAFFLVPIPAGRQARSLLRSYLSTMASIHGQTTDLICGDVDDSTGRLIAAEDAKEGQFVGVAAGLEDKLTKLYMLENTASKLYIGLDTLHQLSALEVDVYRRPHIFPRNAFNQILEASRRTLVLNFIIVNFISQGTIPMRSMSYVYHALDALRKAVASCAAELGAVIDEGKPFTQLLEPLAALDAANTELHDRLAASKADSTNIDGNLRDVLCMQQIAYVMLLGGYELRAAFEPLPKLLAVTQPEAAAEALFKEPLTTDKRNDDESLQQGSLYEVKDSKIEGAKCVLPSPGVDPIAVHDPPALVSAAPSCSALRTTLYNWSERTRVRSWHLKQTLQMAVTFAVAATLNVATVTAEGLDSHAFWIIITIMCIFDTTTGGVVDNGLQRIAGTLVASVVVCIIVSLGYVANGYSYVGVSTGRKIMTASLITIWLGFGQVLATRYSPRYDKFFKIAKLLVPLLAVMDGFKGDDIWRLVGFRIACTLIGIALYFCTALLVFPVTSVDHVRDETAAALAQGACMTELMTRHLTATMEELSSDSTSKKYAEFDALFGRNRKTMGNLIKKRDVLEKEKVAGWLIRSAHHILQKVWCCGAIPDTPGGQYIAFSLPKLDQLIFYLRGSITSLVVAVQVQKGYVANGTWSMDPKWTTCMEAVGIQAAECMKALRLVLLNVAPMEEALKTTEALRAAVAYIGDAFGLDLLEASESGIMDPVQRSAATGLMTAMILYRNMRHLYRATAHALMARQPEVVMLTDKLLKEDILSDKALEHRIFVLVVQGMAAVPQRPMKGDTVAPRQALIPAIQDCNYLFPKAY